MNELTMSLTSIALAIVGVATLAVLVSRNSNTSGVVQATGAAFSGALSTAISPITGSTVQSPASTYANLGGSTFPIS
jgi:PRD1 phage membrane DNA delivery